MLSDQASQTFTRNALAWLGGSLGGTLFAMKWMYHTVAKQLWNLDRQLWRYFTPHISGGLAFVTIALMDSSEAFNPNIFASNERTVALGFLVGFFSDNALAKLAEIADTLFGPTRRTK